MSKMNPLNKKPKKDFIIINLLKVRNWIYSKLLKNQIT